jgi:hypothetical protein
VELGPRGEVAGGSRFFERSPFRSYFFVIDTLLLVMSFASGLLVYQRHHERLSPVAVSTVCIALGGMCLLWQAALRSHRRINQLYRSGAIREVSPGSPLEATIRTAAGMLHLGLCYTFVLTGILLLQIGRLLGH